jgi:TRAP-type mannitol/chloroaromatic compound transport system permease large subunit
MNVGRAKNQIDSTSNLLISMVLLLLISFFVLVTLVLYVVIVLISPMFLLLSLDVIFHGIVGESSDELVEVAIVPE